MLKVSSAKNVVASIHIHIHTHTYIYKRILYLINKALVALQLPCKKFVCIKED